MKPEELVELNEQIAGMARAGLPLDQGLASLARDMSHGRLRSVTKALADDLHSGQTLPEALANRRNELPPFYSAIALAGVRTGRLPEVLYTLTHYARTINSTRNLVVEAMIYPAVVLLLATGIFMLLGIHVIPEFESIFESYRMSLPWTTKLMLSLGGKPIWTMLAVIAVPVVLFFIARFFFLRSSAGQLLWTNFIYSIPLIGTLLKSARLAAFVDLLGLMVEYSVPLPEAFQLAGDASSDPYIAVHANLIRVELERGDSLAKVLQSSAILPEWLAWMSAAGEKRGALAETLRRIGEVYRRIAESRARVLRNTLPTFLIIITATFLSAMFIVTLMLPMLKLLEGLSK